jgi:hypothetical protein
MQGLLGDQERMANPPETIKKVSFGVSGSHLARNSSMPGFRVDVSTSGTSATPVPGGKLHKNYQLEFLNVIFLVTGSAALTLASGSNLGLRPEITIDLTRTEEGQNPTRVILDSQDLPALQIQRPLNSHMNILDQPTLKMQQAANSRKINLKAWVPTALMYL